MRYRVHRVEERDWARLRELRLAALRDTPTGFLETYAEAARHDDAAWRARARRWAREPTSCAFFAEADGADVGLMGGYVDAAGRVTVVSVFVRPEHRGRDADVVGLLLAALAGWALTREGVSELRLEVHQDNARALAAYRRLGFTETGATAPYLLDPGGLEVEMVRRLRGTVLQLAQDPDADALLSRDPFALLVGMLLDQQFPMERAFAGPYLLATRLGADRLDPALLASYDPEEFASLAATPPAVHRYPRSMAARIQALARVVLADYAGDAAAVWTGADSAAELLRRLTALPGFGQQKARIFLALLGKQLGVQPRGWREAAGPYGEEGSRRSVADVVDAGSLDQVRSVKREAKRKGPAGAGAGGTGAGRKGPGGTGAGPGAARAT